MDSGVRRPGLESHMKWPLLVRTEHRSPPHYSMHMCGERVGAEANENIKIFILLPLTLFISFCLPFQLKWTLPIFLSLTFCLFRIFVRWWVEHPARSVNTQGHNNAKDIMIVINELKLRRNLGPSKHDR